MSPSTLSRRELMKWGVAATLGTPLPHAFAQSVLPKGPIALVVPFSAGVPRMSFPPGGAKAVGAHRAQRGRGERRRRWGRHRRRQGGEGRRRWQHAADGHGRDTRDQSAFDTAVPYDAQRDFTSISLVATVPNVLLVSSSVKAQNVRELIALIKAQPGKFNYGSSGVGTPPHLSGELFKSMAGVDIGHVPYKGGGPAMTDLVGGHIPILFDVLTGAASHIRAGSARALAVTTSKRSPSFPDVPTLAEAGLAGYETYTWNAVFGPAKLPRPLVELLSRELQAVVAMQDVQAKLKDLSAVPVGSTPEVLDALVKSELDKWGAVIKSIGGLKRE